MTRRELLAGALVGIMTRPTRGATIFIEMTGGPSHVDTFDLKLGPWTPSWIDPVRFGETLFPAGLMPNLAGMLDRITLIRGLESGRTNHRMIETGWPFLRATGTSFGDACARSIEMVRGGARRVHIRLGSWDHHGNLYPRLRAISRQFDAGVASLISGLDSTRIIAMGEFGRLPGPLNQNGGRDHHPVHAALIAGCGIHGWTTGRTDELGTSVVEPPSHNLACQLFFR